MMCACAVYYWWRCPFDGSPCNHYVKELRWGVCFSLKEDFFGQVVAVSCPRYDSQVRVFCCPWDLGLPCNRYVDGFGYGACRDKDLGVKLRVYCPRFENRGVREAYGLI
jgi:hypothetical protein